MKKLLFLLLLLPFLSQAQSWKTVAVPASPSPTLGQMIIKGAGQNYVLIDSTNLFTPYRSAINARMKYTDSSGMLAAYQSALNSRAAIISGTGYAKWSGTTPTFSATIPWSDISGTSDIDIGASNFFGWSGRSRMSSHTDGFILLTNNAGTGFTSLQFGTNDGTSPSFRKNGSSIDLRLSNNTGWSSIKAGNYTATGNFVGEAIPGVATTMDSGLVRKASDGTFEMRKLPAVGGSTFVILGSDVTNNNASANTLEDVTGLSFAVTSGETYRFKFWVEYTAAASTTGSRWTISGPTTTNLAYTQQNNLDGASFQWASRSAYNQGNLSSGSTTTANFTNVAVVEGVIVPSANGTVQLRFASEISSSAITAKAGSSYLEWRKIN